VERTEVKVNEGSEAMTYSQRTPRKRGIIEKD
jgi:hypothetical protein